MAVKVAINGFGRIGRNVLRAIVESGAPISRLWRSTIWDLWKQMRIFCALTVCMDAFRRGHNHRQHH